MTFLDPERNLTRRERYLAKSSIARSYPVGFTTVSLEHDENLALLIRSLACFGGREVNVIGSLPPYNYLKRVSGSTVDWVKINQFSNPYQFLSYAKDNKIKLVSAELAEDSIDIYQYKFDYNSNTSIIIGGETLGVPVELLINSDIVQIKMGGTGYSLNAATAGAIILNEYFRGIS